MGQRDDDVGPAGAQPGQPGPGCRQDVAGPDPAIGAVVVPALDLRRGKTDHADPQKMGMALAVEDLAAQDGEGRHQGFVPRRAFAQPGRDIGRHHRKLRV